MSDIPFICGLSVTHVKGIEEKTFSVEIFPNIPSILVAPNGFGKSSLASAFASLRKGKIELREDWLHKADETKEPELRLEFNGRSGVKKSLIANPSKNEISEEFSVEVIGSRVTAKARAIQISGRPIATSHLEISEIVFVDRIPEKSAVPYKYADAKLAFGGNGKAIPNITKLLQDPEGFLKVFSVDFSKLKQVKNQKILNEFRNYVNSLTGSSREVISEIEESSIDRVCSVPSFSEVMEKLLDSGNAFGSRAELGLAAFQLCLLALSHAEKIKKTRKYFEYLLVNADITRELRPFKSTWKNIFPKEVKGKLVLSFPRAIDISNGERDTLCLVAALIRAGLRWRSGNLILVIDEVFDYLDDANLIACQYHLTKMIARWRAENRQVYPIILTHLDPQYFKNFTFANQKVSYLSRTNKNPDKAVIDIIKKREEITIKEDVSKHFLHYNPANKDISSNFKAISLREDLGVSHDFYEHVQTQLKRYLNGHNYDPVSVCCAVRIMVERKSMHMIPTDKHQEFIDIHKTTEKLLYAQENGADVPETFFLLSVIYNEAAHIRGNHDVLTPLFSKLDNLTVRHMIEECENSP